MIKARDNPLATHRVLAVRYRPLECTWDDLIDRLAKMNHRAAIVGPKGTGKTTLLEDLQTHLAARGFAGPLIRLSANDCRINWQQLRHLEPNHIVLLDGAEQLSSPRWHWLRWKTRRAAGLIITTHFPGRLPTLIQTSTTPQLLGEVVSELLGRDAPPPHRIEALFHSHRGNVRDALRELYDDFAILPR